MRLLLFFSATRASLLNRESRSLMIVTCQLHSVRRYDHLCHGCTTFGLEMGKKPKFTFGFGSVRGKTSVLVRFVLAGFGLFPISNMAPGSPWMADRFVIHTAHEIKAVTTYMHKTGSKTCFSSSRNCSTSVGGLCPLYFHPLRGIYP